MKHLIWIVILAACTRHPAPASPSTELADRRTQMLGYLANYTDRAVFPTDDQGMPISVFKDARGVRCPMAELMFQSGRADLVDAIAAEDNHARLADVHDGPVYDWMLGSGLTHDEIVMIQGAADLGEMRLQIRELNNHEVITAQRERVRGRLEMAQSALKKDTSASVATATKAQSNHWAPPAGMLKRSVLGRPQVGRR